MSLGAALSIGASIVKGGAGLLAAQQKDDAIRTQMLQNRIQANSQTIMRDEKLRKMIGAQNAQASANGIELSSGSFNAIQVNTFNEFAEDQDNANLTLNAKQSVLRDEQQQIDGAAFFGAVGNLFEAAIPELSGAKGAAAGTTGDIDKVDIFGKTNPFNKSFVSPDVFRVAGDFRTSGNPFDVNNFDRQFGSGGFI